MDQERQERLEVIVNIWSTVIKWWPTGKGKDKPWHLITKRLGDDGQAQPCLIAASLTFKQQMTAHQAMEAKIQLERLIIMASELDALITDRRG